MNAATSKRGSECEAFKMATAEQELASFTSYARQKIDSGDRELSLDELFDQWRAENPSDDQYAENVAAIQASIQDFKNGDRGTVAGEHSAQLRSALNDAGQ
jgi:hypothetical protein